MKPSEVKKEELNNWKKKKELMNLIMSPELKSH